jgi:hypothetical protein
MKTLKYPTTLKDCLYNFHPSSGSNPVYNKGLIVGAISGLMAVGYTFEDACQLVNENLPSQNNLDVSLPESWIEVFAKYQK